LNSSEENTSVERVSVEALPPRQPKPRLVPSQAQMLEAMPQAQQSLPLTIPIVEQPKDPRAIDLVLSAFAAAGYALSARAILLLSIVGAFVLAVQAMSSQTMMALYVLCAYAIGIVLPVVVLEIRRRAPDGS